MALEDFGKRTRFSAILRLFATRPQERIAISELLDGFGDRSFGAAMLLLALPNLVPLPPGASTLFGLPLILIAGQMALGGKAVWLPASIRRRSIATALLSRIVSATRPPLRRAERLLQPRLAFMLGPLSTQLVGAACVILAVLIALPIPLANFLSGLSISVFALGLLRHDGIAIILGWAVALVSVVATVLVSGAAWMAAERLLAWAGRLF